MPEGSGNPPKPPSPPGSPPAGRPASPGARRPSIGLQVKLPCATVEELKARYGADLRLSRLFLRTRTPRPVDTLVRLEAQLSDGTPVFRAGAVVAEALEPPEPGMRLQLLAVDEAGRQLIAALGGRPLPPMRAEAPRPPSVPPAAAARPLGAPPRTTLPSVPPAAPRSVPPRAPASFPPPRPNPTPAPARPAPRSAPPRPAPTPVPPVPVYTPPPARAVAAPAGSPAARRAPVSSVPPRPAPMIGIDLGTTNSAAAVVKNGKPFVIPSREGYNTIPSIVAVNDKGNLIVGHPAKSQLLINPKNTVFGAKRLVGRQFSSTVVTDLVGRFPYQIVAGERGEAAVHIGQQQFSLQQISALVLKEVKELADQHLKADVTRAVITVPAYYNDNQRNAVREAGELAGLKVERILNEPTAAALAFGHGRNLEQRVLVYDLGGGTFDASVLELHGSVYEVVSTGGDTFLGGVDFDKVIVDHLLAVFRDKNRIDFPGDRVALQRVTDAAERAKITLSEQLEVQIKVPFVALVDEKPYDLEATLTRAELVLLTGHLIDRTLKVCAEVLAAKDLRVDDLAEVLLVGGQSRMPLVRERIRDFFGREPSKAVHPDEAVALGAALLADSIDSGDIDGVVLVDVLPMSIGVGLPGGEFRVVIERNTTLPCKRAVTVSTTSDDQESLELAIFQGDEDGALDNEYLGTLSISPLPAAEAGSLLFDVVFSVSTESILAVTAEDKTTGRTVTANFSTTDTPEAVGARLGVSPTAQRARAGAVPDKNVGLANNGWFGWLKRLFGGGKEDQPRA